MKISTFLFLLFFNLVVLGSCRMAESGVKAEVWWASFFGIAASLVFLFTSKKRTGLW
jgi:hypothetical protein